jgi:CRP/FNR family transcriptional regulator
VQSPELARALERVSYLRDLSTAERGELIEASALRRLPAGSTLFLEGDEAAGIFLITDGRIKVVRSSNDGREQVLHEEGPGTTLAEVPVFAGGGYVGSAICVESCVVLFVAKEPLLRVVSRNPSSAIEVMRVLASRIRKLALVVEDLSLRDVTARTAAYLVREMDRLQSMDFDLPPTREQLAAHIGTVREQASRALSHLRSLGLIELDGRRVRILSPDRIRAVALHGRD